MQVRLAALAVLLVACGPSTSVASDAAPDAPLAVDAGPPPPPSAEPGRHDVSVVETRRIVPSDGIPAATPPQTSNNNLDVVRHDGRVYLAWRTAPYHFAHADARIHVVSSTDETTWSHETTLAMGTDLREPRLLSWEGRLFLYVARLGTDRYRFEPMGVFVSERLSDGTWTEAERIPALDGYIAWRTRVERGTPYMTAYRGGEHIYLFDGLPLASDLFTTTDGRTWTPLDPARPTLYAGGGSETDFALADDGSLYGVIRVEAIDEGGLGSRVCHAEAGALASWSCAPDARKYDSPHVFAHDGEVYLVARRHLTETGAYDLTQPGDSPLEAVVRSQTDYVRHPKRCALWRFVQGEARLAYLLDLPSRGDTCFAASLAIEGRPDELALYDYSSDVEGPDVSWREGQEGPTYVYRHVLRFTAR